MPKQVERSVLYIGPRGPLRDRAERVVAAAGMRWIPALSDQLARQWRESTAVLIDAGELADLVREDPLRRENCVVICLDEPKPMTWQHCVWLGVHNAVQLPGSETWLVDWLGRVGITTRGTGLVAGVLGACGGVGATTTAAGMAVAAAREGAAMLVDLDGLSVGHEIVFGPTGGMGGGWADLKNLSGQVSIESLREALPSAGSITLVGHANEERCEEPPESARRALLLAARQGMAATVVDLPRTLPLLREISTLLDACLIVITADIKAVLAARRLVALLGELELPVVAGIRRSKRGGLPFQTILDVLDLPRPGKWAHIAEIRGFNKRLRSGAPIVVESDHLTTSCTGVLDNLRTVAAKQTAPMSVGSS